MRYDFHLANGINTEIKQVGMHLPTVFKEIINKNVMNKTFKRIGFIITKLFNYLN